MLFYSVLVCFVFVLFQVKFPVTSQMTKQSLKNDDDDVQYSFAKLLKSIVKVNEERMNAMKKITQLQDYMFTKNRLKSDDDAYDSDEEDEETHVIFALEEPPKLRRTEDEIVTQEVCKKLLLGSPWTNKFFKQACPLRASGICERACMKTFLNVCENFSCYSKVRRNIKTECRNNCRNAFLYDDKK